MKTKNVPLTKAQQCMVEENINLAYKLAWDLYKRCRVFPLEDVKQICCVGLCQAAAKYNPDVGTAFSTLAYVSMQRLFYHELRDKRQPEMVSLDQGCGDDEDPAMDFLMAKLCAENVLDENTLCLALDFETYLSTENPMRQKIMRLMLSGFNGCDIAKAVGCTTQNVSRIKLAVAKNFANWMEGRKQNE